MTVGCLVVMTNFRDYWQVSRNKDGSMTLKLADFGLAMEVTEPIYTVCGTPTYVAPEILAETGGYWKLSVGCGEAAGIMMSFALKFIKYNYVVLFKDYVFYVRVTSK